MSKVSTAPKQVLAEGVTVMVAVAGVIPGLFVTNARISPVPLAAKPIAGLLFVQLNAVPFTVPTKLISVVEEPSHSIWSLTGPTVGVGFTIILKVSAIPVHPFAEGVTVMVAVTVVSLVFVTVKIAMSPFPAAAKPIEGVSFVQEKEVPPTVSTKLITAVEAPLHNVWGFTGSTVGVGFTVMVNVSSVPVHPLAEGVTMMVAVTAILLVLIAVKMAMSPFPAAGSPMDGVSFVQENEVPDTVSTKLIAVVEAPLHKVCGVTGSTVGVGFTVIVNVCDAPVHPLADGVTVIVAVTAVSLVFVAVKMAMFPFPAAVKPIEGVSFVQSKEVPPTVSTKPMAAVEAPLHKVCGFTGSTVGVGFTVMVNISLVPVHPLAEGVTVMVAVTAILLVLIAVKMAMSPFPAAGSPMDGVSFVQENEVPDTVSTKLIAVVEAPLHKVCGVTGSTVGVGFTVIVNVCDAPVHPLADGVTVIVAVTAVSLVFVAVKMAMFPFPAAVKPIEGVSFVQSKEVPPTVSTKPIAVVEAPLHNICGVTGATVGVGFTVMIYVSGVPLQPLAVGVMEILAVAGVLPVLVAVNPGISPVPLADKPMEVLSFVQLNVDPATLPFTGVIGELVPLQILWSLMAVTEGVGFTVIV